jgi:hypothetical protein
LAPPPRKIGNFSFGVSFLHPQHGTVLVTDEKTRTVRCCTEDGTSHTIYKKQLKPIIKNETEATTQLV